MATTFGTNIAMVQVRMLLDGQEVENTFGLQAANPISAAGLLDSVSNIMLLWISNIMPLVGPLCSLREVYAKTETAGTNYEAASTDPALTPGTLGGTNHPNNVTACVTFRTGLVGRSFRGRNYVPGMTTDSILNNTFDTGWVAAIIQAYNDVFTGMLATDDTAVVVSRWENGLPRLTGIVTAISTATVRDDTADSQRRRLPGRGR